MVIVCAGLEKSGTAYLYNMINALVSSSGGFDANNLKGSFIQNRVIRGHNNLIQRWLGLKLVILWFISLVKGPFVVKTHRVIPWLGRVPVKTGLIKVIFIYRDPRDIVLSLLDHGKKSRKSGRGPFSNIKTIDDARKFVCGRLKNVVFYSELKNTLCIRYENLLDNPAKLIRSIAAHIGTDINEAQINGIIWKYNKDNPKKINSTHLNKARSRRYVDEMDDSDIAILDQSFSSYYPLMGFAIFNQESEPER